MRKFSKFTSIFTALAIASQLIFTAYAISPPGNDFNYAAYSQGNIKLFDTGTINGDAVSSSGSIYTHSSSNKVTGRRYDKNDNLPFNYTFPGIPDAPSIANHMDDLACDWYPATTIAEDYSFDSLTINGPLTIDCDSGDRILVVENLIINGGSIVLHGTGRLIMYVKNDVTINNSFIFNINGQSDRVHVFVSGDLKVSAFLQMKGNWYVDGNIDFTCGGSRLEGNIVAGGNKVNLRNDCWIKGAVYVPDANTELTGASHVHGYVVCKNLELTGCSGITFVPRSISIPNSSPEPPDPPPTPSGNYTNGILGEYFDSANNDNESYMRMIRIDSSPDYNWEYNSPDTSIEKNTFSVRWTGFIEVPRSDNYTFYTYSDDGVKMTFNGQEIINRWGLLNLEFSNSSSIRLEAGIKYPIKIDYQQIPLNSTFFLFWKPEHGGMEIVPETAFYVKKDIYSRYNQPQYVNPVRGNGTGLKAQFFDGADGVTSGAEPSSITCGIVDYDWGLNTPIPNPTSDGFSGLFTGYIEGKYTETVTLEVVVDDGVKMWIDKKLVLDKWIPNSRVSYTVPVEMKNGKFNKIQIQYNDVSECASIQLYWMSDGQEKQLIPAKYLYTASPD